MPFYKAIYQKQSSQNTLRLLCKLERHSSLRKYSSDYRKGSVFRLLALNSKLYKKHANQKFISHFLPKITSIEIHLTTSSYEGFISWCQKFSQNAYL